MEYAKALRRSRPIVQCITNLVTANDCANVLLAAGASATMAHHPLEVEEIQTGCGALVCNLGATESYDAMLLAAAKAKELSHPLVIDPVGCGGSAFRRAFFQELVRKGKPTVIRGNYAEIKALHLDTGTVTGVDAFSIEEKDYLMEIEEAVMGLAKRLDCIVVASGCKDFLGDGRELKVISGGDDFMSQITGTGCMESALLGAYLAAVEQEDYVKATLACCQRMKEAGHLAGEKVREAKAGTMTFRLMMIDEISNSASTFL